MGEFVVIIVCLFFNAVFAAVEMAFVTITKSRLREAARIGNRDAARILALRDNPERTLSIIQVGITVVGSVAAAVGGVGAMNTISPWMQAHWGLSSTAASAAAVVAVVLPITYVNVVLGELVPKTLALKNPLAIVLFSARYLIFFDRIFSPVVSIFELSTRFVLNLLKAFTNPRAVVVGVKAVPKVVIATSDAASGTEGAAFDSQALTRPGLSMELEQLSDQTREYVLNLVDLERQRIRDVRLPWSQVVSVRLNDEAAAVERAVLSSGHTRLPVMNGCEVVGIINTKEFMVLTKTSVDSDWRNLVRPVVKVDEGAPILRALRRMQDQRSHLSITFKNGTLSGIVTIEDIFEEIIGDIFDEDDDGKLRRVLLTASRFRSYAAESTATNYDL